MTGFTFHLDPEDKTTEATQRPFSNGCASSAELCTWTEPEGELIVHHENHYNQVHMQENDEEINGNQDSDDDQMPDQTATSEESDFDAQRERDLAE